MVDLLNEINQLPETVPDNILNQYFRKAIDTFTFGDLDDKEYFTEVISELADKQWHNYKKLDASLLNELDTVFVSILSGKLSLKLVEHISESIGQLGLVNTYQVFKELTTNSGLSNDIRSEITATVREFGESVEDPYKEI